MIKRAEANKIAKHFWWRNFAARLTKKFWEMRARKIAKYLLPYIPEEAKVLDVGAGNGMIAEKLVALGRKNIVLLDVFDWNISKMPLVIFDGRSIPFADKEFDAALLIDVIHHSENEEEFVKEALRVAKKVIVSEEAHEGLPNFFANIFDNLQYLLFGMPLGFHRHNHKSWIALFEKLSPVVSCEKKYFNHSIFILGDL